jgi:hypothetical protein
LRGNNFHGDAENNLVILNYDSPTAVTSENWPGHLFYGLTSNHVESVISNGQWVVKDRKLVKKNEDEILAFSKQQALRLWEQLK